MPFKKKPTNISRSEELESFSNENWDVTETLCFAVAEAAYNRMDITEAIMKAANCTRTKAFKLQDKITKSELYKKCFDEYKAMQEATVFGESRKSMMVHYNELIRQATNQKKYEIVLRILDKIKELQGINNDEMDFNITFKFKPTDIVNLEMIKEGLSKSKEK